MQEKVIQNVDFILKNIKSKTGARNDADLASFFDVKPGTISAWKIRNSINYDLLIAKCIENNYDLNDIILGKSTECVAIKTDETPITNNTDPLISVISKLNTEIVRLAEENGALKEQNKLLRQKTGYTNNNMAAEV